MKVAADQGPATIMSGGMQMGNVSISDDPEDQLMILNVLSNTLYTDKPAAVLREYGCNAADANVEAGKGDQPIEVRLPNKLDPTLSIRDFGYGMTEEQILNTFIRLGRSTKRNSNAFTGMLGIGSKAGFAYGDSFLVTSYTGDKKEVYNLYRDQGVPKWAKMHEEPSDAPSGVEVKVPIRHADMDEFISKAERIFRYFRVRPIIHGAKIEWEDRTHQFAGTGWRYTGRGDSVAIMGNVGYELNAAALGFTSQRYMNNESKVESLLGLGIELDFNIGDLNIAATREGLEYNDRTKKAVLARLEVVMKEIGKIFTDKIAAATSLWEAKMHYHDNFEDLDTHHRYSLKKVVDGQIIWRGTVINSGEVNIENDLDKADAPKVHIMRVSRHDRGGKVCLRNRPAPSEVRASEKVTLVINDSPTKKQSPSRMRGWFTNNTDCNTIVVFSFLDEATQKKFWAKKQLDGAPTVNMTSITPLFAGPSSSGAQRNHNIKHSAKAFVLDEKFTTAYSNAAKSSWWKKEDVDAKDGEGVYVTLDKFCVFGVGMGETPEALGQKVKALRAAGLLKGPVYGFKADRAGKLGKKWVRLEVAMQKSLDDLITKKQFSQELSDFLHAESYDTLIEYQWADKFPQGTIIRKMLDDHKRMHNPKATKAMLMLVHSNEASPWLAQPTLPERSIDLYKSERDVLQRYPLLSYVGKNNLSCMGEGEIKNVAAYIRMVEAA